MPFEWVISGVERIRFDNRIEPILCLQMIVSGVDSIRLKKSGNRMPEGRDGFSPSRERQEGWCDGFPYSPARGQVCAGMTKRAGMRGWVPAFVFTGQALRRNEGWVPAPRLHGGRISTRGQGKGDGNNGWGEGVFHVGMVARDGEFRQWRHVSRSGSVVVGYSGQGNERSARTA